MPTNSAFKSLVRNDLAVLAAVAGNREAALAASGTPGPGRCL